MSRKETALTNRILIAHGSRPDVRLFRNATFNGWVGPFVTRTSSGGTLLGPGTKRIQGGLCEGSADIIGICRGRFVALECKTSKHVRIPQLQRNFIRMVRDLGGIAGIVRSVEDATRLLGEPPCEPAPTQDATGNMRLGDTAPATTSDGRPA